MVQSGDWVTPRVFGEPQFEKPILFYWETSACQVLLGDNEFAARLPGALAASLVAGYFPARKAASLQPVDVIRGAS